MHAVVGPKADAQAALAAVHLQPTGGQRVHRCCGSSRTGQAEHEGVGAVGRVLHRSVRAQSSLKR